MSYQKSTTTFNPARGIASELLKFQPCGICVDGTIVTITDYFGPSVQWLEVSYDRDLVTLKTNEWVKGIVGANRLFPDIHPTMGANRMQVALPLALNYMGLVRNYDDTLYLVDKREDGKWYAGAQPPLQLSIPGGGMINSLLFDWNHFVGIFCGPVDQEWTIAGWSGSDGSLISEIRKVPPYRYGIAKLGDSLLTVTDARSSEPYGIYKDERLIVPDVTGIGIAVLDEGRKGALVTQYTYEDPLFDSAPLLTYIPPQLLLA